VNAKSASENAPLLRRRRVVLRERGLNCSRPRVAFAALPHHQQQPCARTHGPADGGDGGDRIREGHRAEAADAQIEVGGGIGRELRFPKFEHDVARVLVRIASARGVEQFGGHVDPDHAALDGDPRHVTCRLPGATAHVEDAIPSSAIERRTEM
jgi:hypothetical protein